MVYSISLLLTQIPSAWVNRMDVNKMSGWGNNPATVGAAATAVTAAAIIVAWLSLRESKTQRGVLESEIANRMRPWVGLFEFGFDGVKRDEAILRVLLRNFGPLPAQKARLKLAFEPREADSDKPDPFIWQEPAYKVLMPGEDGNYPMNLIRFPEVMEWIGANRDVIVNGTFEYGLGEKEFQSQFQATLRFSRSQSEKKEWFTWNRTSSVTVPILWRNTSAT